MLHAAAGRLSWTCPHMHAVCCVLCVYVCLYECVCEREKERDREEVCVRCVCVCACACACVCGVCRAGSDGPLSAIVHPALEGRDWTPLEAILYYMMTI